MPGEREREGGEGGRRAVLREREREREVMKKKMTHQGSWS